MLSIVAHAVQLALVPKRILTPWTLHSPTPFGKLSGFIGTLRQCAERNLTIVAHAVQLAFGIKRILTSGRFSYQLPLAS